MNPQDTTLLAAAVVESQDGYTQAIRTGKHHFQADEPASLGGADQGPAPYQLLMGSLGACTAITLKMYAARKGWDLSPFTVKLKLFREQDNTERVERVLSFGPSVSEEQRARLLDISAKTPVTLTLSRALRIETTVAPSST